MEQQPESRSPVALWVRVFACLLAIGGAWVLVTDVQKMWHSGLTGDLTGFVASVLLTPVFAFIALTGYTPRWGFLGADLSKAVSWKSFWRRGD